jgi:hypothetical protein
MRRPTRAWRPATAPVGLSEAAADRRPFPRARELRGWDAVDCADIDVYAGCHRSGDANACESGAFTCSRSGACSRHPFGLVAAAASARSLARLPASPATAATCAPGDQSPSPHCGFTNPATRFSGGDRCPIARTGARPRALGLIQGIAHNRVSAGGLRLLQAPVRQGDEDRGMGEDEKRRATAGFSPPGRRPATR